MATDSFMLQLYAEQEYDQLVTEVYPLEQEAFLLLDPTKNTIVREIASETLGGVLVSGMPGAYTFGIPSNAFTTVSLLPSQGTDETVLYAPSNSPSPPVSGIGLAILRVTEAGVGVDPAAKLSLRRGVGAHVYVDQVD